MCVRVCLVLSGSSPTSRHRDNDRIANEHTNEMNVYSSIRDGQSSTRAVNAEHLLHSRPQRMPAHDHFPFISHPVFRWSMLRSASSSPQSASASSTSAASFLSSTPVLHIITTLLTLDRSEFHEQMRKRKKKHICASEMIDRFDSEMIVAVCILSCCLSHTRARARASVCSATPCKMMLNK